MGSAAAILYFLIPVSIAAVIAVLGVGLYALARGGAFNKKNSNKLMQMRVALQAVAIAIIMLFLWVSGQSGGG